jgi:hypothetical protein
MDMPEYKEIFPTRLREEFKPLVNGKQNKVVNIMQLVLDQQLQVEVHDLLIIDDPHSEQDAMNIDALERAYEWYTSGPRQRLQPGGAIRSCYDKMECKRFNWSVAASDGRHESR